jgi:transcription termination/antitermination protein NusG
MSVGDQAGNESEKSEQSQEKSSLDWYVLHVYSSCEKKVIELLRQRISVKGLEKSFGEILVPTEEVVSLRSSDKKRVKTDRKFFPGYVLIQMEMNDVSWHLVKSVPKVLGFIGGTTERPAPITQKEVDAILNRLTAEAEGKPKPKTLFEPGELVRVIEGPFADFNGVVEDVNYEKSRLRVSVLIFGRATPVELEFTQVEKAS